MAIKFNRIINENVIQDGDYILTPLYGKIKVTDKIDDIQYTYFDSIDGYDLFVSNLADDTLAIKTENDNVQNNDKISSDIKSIEQKYEVDLIKFDDTNSAIIIKVLENKINVLDKIEIEYKDDKFYNLNRITPQVLFLELTNADIQLEDTSAIDKLSDQDMKNVIQKAGVKLSGSENKERLKGIMQGVLSTTSNK